MPARSVFWENVTRFDWSKVTLFHMDEYLGITADHPNLTDDLKVPTQLKLGALRADAGIVGAAFATTLHQGVWIKPAKVAGE